ncbi:hypothetical protein [Alteromonas antoniana]|uniref:hypothetical protein n=1 Tax=Alteromonas antoniana TaxID=2803813 RepID=UPI001C44A8CD|nr:hypothetical protein [Alteromonas antoniana]
MSEIIHKDIDYRVLRLIVGTIAISIAVVCTVLFWVSTDTRIIPTSISVTYHLGARDFFVGALFAVGGFLLAYKGWTDSEFRLAKIAGICAILVAVNPTSIDKRWVDNVPLPFDQTKCKTFDEENNAPADDYRCITTGTKITPVIHGAAAFALIGILFFYCVGFYRRAREKLKTHHSMGRIKRRIVVYFMCAAAMVVSAVVGGCMQLINTAPDNTAIFWVEFVCLWAFGISWLVASKRIPYFSHKKEEEDQADDDLSDKDK